MFEIIAIALCSTVVLFPLCLAFSSLRSKRNEAEMRLGKSVCGHTFHGSNSTPFQ